MKSASQTGAPRNISISKTWPAADCDLIRSNKQSPNRNAKMFAREEQDKLDSQ
jgi:hypothetical protein